MQQISETIRLFAEQNYQKYKSATQRLPNSKAKASNTISILFFISCFYFRNSAGTICWTARQTFNFLQVYTTFRWCDHV